MDTEFEILRRFETQLMRVAERDKRRAESPPPKRSRRPWRAAIAVAAALLGLSFVVGLLATGGSVLGGGSAASSASSAAGSAPNPGPSSAPGFGLPAGGGQALGVSARRAWAAHLGVKAPASKLRPRSIKAQRRAPARSHAEQPASAPPDQADLSKIIRDGRSRSRSPTAPSRRSAGAVVAHRRGRTAGRSCPPPPRAATAARSRCASPRPTSTRRWCSSRSSARWTPRRVQGQDVTAEYVDLEGAHEDLSRPGDAVLFGLMAAGDHDRPDARRCRTSSTRCS